METTKPILDSIRKYGIKKTFKVVSAICWFLFPFILWLQIHRIIERRNFVDLLALPGQIAVILITVIMAYWIISIVRYEPNLMKKIEHAKQVFENPSDPTSEKNFRKECSRFVVPYLYYGRMALVGMPTLFGAYLWLNIIGLFVGLYLSYSIFTFFLANQSYFVQVFSEFSSIIPILQDLAEIGANNQELLLILMFLFFVSWDPMVSMVRNPHVESRVSVVLIGFLQNLLHMHTKVSLTIALVPILPIYLKRRQKRAIYEPFIFPANLHLVMQKAVHNVGRKKCQVSIFSYNVQDEQDIVSLQNIIGQDKDLSTLFRLSAISADVQQAMSSVKRAEPELCLGFVGHKCAILGKISFDLDKKVRKAEFLFDSVLLKKEFKLIADKEISKVREIEPRLPDSLKEIINRYKGKEKED